MSCYHPMKAFVVGVTDSGKRDLSIQPYTADYVVKVNGTWRPRCGAPALNEGTAEIIIKDYFHGRGQLFRHVLNKVHESRVT